MDPEKLNPRYKWWEEKLIRSPHATFLLASASSVMAVKRMSALFVVLWGDVILREVNIHNRLSRGLLMVAGVVFIGMEEGNVSE